MALYQVYLDVLPFPHSNYRFNHGLYLVLLSFCFMEWSGKHTFSSISCLRKIFSSLPRRIFKIAQPSLIFFHTFVRCRVKFAVFLNLSYSSPGILLRRPSVAFLHSPTCLLSKILANIYACLFLLNENRLWPSNPYWTKYTHAYVPGNLSFSPRQVG